jgi:signal transduction histidine kinase
MSLRSSWTRLVPWTAAFAFAIIGIVEILLDPEFRADPTAPAAGVAVLVIGAALTAWSPLVGCLVGAAIFPVTTLLGLNGPTGVGVLGFFLLPGWAGFREEPRRSWWAPVGCQLMATLGIALAGVVPDSAGASAPTASTVWENLFFSTLCWVSWGVGLLSRRTRERAEQLSRLATALDIEREAREQAAVVEERQRIAREVHDAVAHSVSVMTLQVGALRTTLAPDDPATDVLQGIERLGRESVQELRGLVGILREPPSGPPAPQPGLARTEELLAEVRAAGLPVDLRIEGDVSGLPRALDISAYRILQEALTNVLRHAGKVATSVLVTCGRDRLVLEVVDQGAPRPDRTAQEAAPIGGHGLVGMRERVAMFGGSLEARHQPSGGFLVRAEFPVRVS